MCWAREVIVAGISASGGLYSNSRSSVFAWLRIHSSHCSSGASWTGHRCYRVMPDAYMPIDSALNMHGLPSRLRGPPCCTGWTLTVKFHLLSSMSRITWLDSICVRGLEYFVAKMAKRHRKYQTLVKSWTLPTAIQTRSSSRRHTSRPNGKVFPASRRGTRTCHSASGPVFPWRLSAPSTPDNEHHR